jgi:cation diffusion facilitator CzcD-associated flavoprotein CzcO
MTESTDLLVIGAGPYACSTAAFAREHGIDVRVVGRPMAFWRDQMPQGMFLRSSTDWHLDAAGVHTFAAYLEDAGLTAADLDPVPIQVFLDYTEWFLRATSMPVDQRLVSALTTSDGGFVATMDDGSQIRSQRVLAAPGIRYFANLPAWSDLVPADRRGHTSELVDFDALAGARVVVVGGRQSAYEWAALLCDHGAERVDVVHRHATPAFARVSWAFVDDYLDRTEAHRGWWRGLPAAEQQAVAAEFWRVGRLTLEPWLVPRLVPGVVTSHAGCAVTDVVVGDRDVTLTLSDGGTTTADHVVFASGYRADMARVPYLAPVLDRLSVTDGYPDLSAGFETSISGLYVNGFASTRDFGPFFGFTRGCPTSARLTVAELLR